MRKRIIRLFEEFKMAIDDDKPYEYVFPVEGKKAIEWEELAEEEDGDLRVSFETLRGDTVTAKFEDVGNEMGKRGSLFLCNFGMVTNSSSDGQLYTADIFYKKSGKNKVLKIQKIQIR
jgi:hypothetical protein